MNNLYKITRKDITKSCEVISRSFYNDPMMIYYFPDDEQRKKIAPHLWKFLIKDRMKYGGVFASSQNIEGIVAWLDSTTINMRFLRAVFGGVLNVITKAGSVAMKRMIKFTNFSSKIHKKHISDNHLYLSFIGVDPVYQGKGYGSILIKELIFKAENEKKPIYLETQNRDNVKIYEHFGFKVVDESILQDTELNNWSMIWFP